MSESSESRDILDELKEWAKWLRVFQARVFDGSAAEPHIVRLGRTIAEIERLRLDNDRLCAAVARLEAERDATERRALRARAWEYDPGGRD